MQPPPQTVLLLSFYRVCSFSHFTGCVRPLTIPLLPGIMMSTPSPRKFSSIACNVRKRSVNHGDTVVRVPANGRIQSLKINTLLNYMPDNIIRTVKTFTNKFNTTTGQLNFQLWQSTQGCYEFGVCSGRKIQKTT